MAALAATDMARQLGHDDPPDDLLRAVNITDSRLPMSELREIATELDSGSCVASSAHSGNWKAALQPRELER